VSAPRDYRRAFIVEDAPPAVPPAGPRVDDALPTRPVEGVEVATVSTEVEERALAIAGARPRRRLRITPVRLLAGSALALLVAATGVDAWRFLATTFASSLTLGLLFTLLIGLLVGATVWTGLAVRRDLRDLGEVEALRRRAQGILQGGDDLDLAGPDLVAALGRHYAGHPQLAPLLEEFQDRADSSLSARWQVEQLSRQVFAALDQVAFDTVKRHSQQAALLAMLSRTPLIELLIALWRSLALVRQVARTYGGRPGAAGLWRLWRGVLRNVVYAPVGEVAADTLGQVLGGGVAAKLSTQAAHGLGMGLLIGRLGHEAIRACRPLPFTGREATQPSLKVLGEGMLQLLKGSLTKASPEAVQRPPDDRSPRR
jgi:putative membrane protein